MFENSDARPSEAGWLDVKLLRNRNQRLSLGNAHRRQGIFQIAVMSPLSIGAMAADRIAESVQAAFPSDAEFGPARVTETPTIADGFPDGAWWRVPVSVYFEAL